MDNFLKTLAKTIHQKHPANLHEQAFVFPGKRAIQFFKQALIEEYGFPLIMPAFYSVNDFFERLSPYSSCSKLTAMLLLHKSFEMVKSEKEDFKAFQNKASAVLSDFNEIDLYNLNIRNFFAALNAEYTLRFWQQEEQQLTKHQQEYLDFWKLLPELYFTFNQLLEDENLAYTGKLYRNVADNIENEHIFLQQHNCFYFVGLNALSAVELNVYKVLQKQHKAYFYWDYGHSWNQAPFDTVATFVKRNAQILGGTNIDSSKMADIVITECNSTHEEILGVQNVLSGLSSEQIANTAIVLGNENVLLPLINHLPKDLTKVNISLGYPMDQTYAQELMRCLRQFINEFSTNAIAKNSVVDLFQIFFPSSGHTEYKFVQLEDLPFVANRVFLIEYFEKNWPEMAQLFQNFSESQVPIFLEKLSDLLRSHFDNFEFLQAIDESAIAVLQSQVKQMQDTFQRYKISLNINESIELILRAFSGEKISYVGKPLEDLQIVGILESRNLSFDNVILLDAVEGSIPVLANSRSYIPFNLRAQFKLPGKKEREEVFAYYFFRLLKHSSSINILSLNSSDGMKVKEESRYLKLIKLLDQKEAVTHKIVQLPDLILKENPPIRLEGDIRASLIDYLHKSALSPTAFNNLFQNPFDFYLRYICRVEEVEKGNIYAAMGTLTHRCLELLYTPQKNQILSKDVLNDMQSKLSPCFKIAIEEWNNVHLFTDAERLMIKESAMLMLRNHLAKELNFVAEGNEIIYLDGEQKISNELDCGLVKIKVAGYIDRVDRCNGVYRVLDYKTGAVSNTDVKVTQVEDLRKKDKALQLCIYRWLSQSSKKIETCEAGILPLKSRGDYILSLRLDKDFNDSNFQEEFTHFLVQSIQELLSKDFTFDYSKQKNFNYFQP